MYLEKNKMIYNLERDEYKICSTFFSMQMKCFLVNLRKSQKSQIRNFFLIIYYICSWWFDILSFLFQECSRF